MRIIYFSLGWVMVALGVIGLVMPLMPGMVFLIVAVACFARSSPRFEAWLLDHPTFGKPLRDWRATGAIPRSAKAMACVGMTIGFLVFWYSVNPSLPLAIAVAVMFLACAIYVVSRPAMADGNGI
ncbi:YbaN family protein [Bradyrhizobium sp. RDI18]|uniref:YbaN family protein n=1 Tax=Bradyrhizobium sp. RDI18 TaxID=3367400 RepID=UPI003717685B